jgi:hypothetical protein
VKLTVVVPATHTKTDVKDRPLPESRSEIVLLVRVRDKRVVRSHHGDVKVDEVLEEGRLVITRVAGRKLLVGVAFDVPVSVDITRVVLLNASGLDLLKTPLWQIDIASSEVATEVLVSESQGSRKCTNPRVIPRSGIANNLNNPVILGVADGSVTVARNFVVGLSDGSGDLVRVKVAACLSMDKTDDIAVSGEAELLICLVRDIVTVRVEEPIVVSILVVVASDLLLSRAFRIGLNVRVEQTSSVTHVLQCDAGAVCDLERTVLANLCAAQVSLEKRTHLGVTRTAVLEDQEVEVEGEGVDGERNEDETEHAEGDVCNKFHLVELALFSEAGDY